MRHSVRVKNLPSRQTGANGDTSGRHRRTAWSLPLFASFVTGAFIAVIVASPAQAETVTATVAPAQVETQTFAASDNYTNTAARDAFSVSEIVVAPPTPVALGAPAAGTPDPGTAQAVAYEMLMGMGLGEGEYSCLVALWNRESGWNVYAHNASSGAYGIPQALPGEKMASAGADWATNPATQISWGLSYINGRYGSPCGAWAFSESNGWY